jgi:lipopolysaccharide assembly outer membrane protein LptD (OstA)
MTHSKIRLRTAIMAALFAMLPVSLVHAAKTEAPKSDTEMMTINADSANVDMEAEEFTIPGAVEIKLGDIHVTGRNLKFNKKTMIAELSGNPLVAELGTDIRAEAGHVALDINEQKALLSGGCRMTQTRKDSLVDFESEKIDANYGENGWAESAGEVKIHYKKIAGAGKPGQKPAEGSPEKKPMIDTEEVFGTAGSVYYALDTHLLDASHTVRIELKDGAFSASALKGDLDKEKLALSGGIQGKIKDVSFSANRMDINYNTQEADIWGGVKAERDNGDRYQSEHIYFKYKEGERTFNSTGGTLANLKVEKGKLKPKAGQEKPAPEGGKP